MMHKPALTLLFLLMPAAHAQVVDVSGCRAVQDREERFRCYEALGDSGQSRETAPAQAEPAPPTRIERERFEGGPENSRRLPVTLENFGSQDERRARLEEDAEGMVELHDTIVSLERIRPNVWDITLASGQVWRQVTSKYYNLHEGDEVRIYPSRWGKNFRLSAENLDGFIQVRRLR